MTTPTEHDREIQALAELLIARRGERAATYATYQSLKASHRGEQRMSEAWRSIADTADLEHAGLVTLEDLLYRFPLRYEDRSRLQPIASTLAWRQQRRLWAGLVGR